DHEAALVWRKGRIARVLGAGTHAVWTALEPVVVTRVDRRDGRLVSPNLAAVVQCDAAGEGLLEAHLIADGFVGTLFRDGELHELLGPGFHVFWRGPVKWHTATIDIRERSSDVAGQDIITHDKVTLRINALITWRITDVRVAMSTVQDIEQALYREAQLALRAVIGTRTLDALLEDKVTVTDELLAAVRARATDLGLTVHGVGIRDIILPGDMRELLNRVTEARTAAEAAVITRREETAAMRSQANTAKLFEQNPTLMRLKELEVMERVVQNASLNIFAGDGGIKDKLLKLV
ncbi:MAG: regulator of protease activity HflC (stomatin/prohibitin superfamily), partial [Myxococcota bacterium]